MRPSDYFNNCIGVFQGGGCKAIAYIGAYKRAHELGIMFSEVAGTSAGSIIAAMIAIGCPPHKLEEIINDTDFSSLAKRAKYDKNPLICIILDIILAVFYIITASIITILIPLYVIYFFIRCIIFAFNFLLEYFTNRNIFKCARNKPKFAYFKLYVFSFYFLSSIIHHSWGIFDSTVIKETIERWFQMCGVDKNITFGELAVQLHVVATDVFRRQAKVWSCQKTPNMSVAKAVTASCSIPLFFTPIDWIFVDGGIISNRPDFLFYANKHKYTKILSFSLKGSNRHYRTRLGFISELISSIIDGSDKLQHEMLPLLPDTISIDHGDIEATSFNRINRSKIQELISYGETAVDSFLNKQTQRDLMHLINNSRGKIVSRERLYTQIASWSMIAPERVVIYEPTLDWVWSLFPTLISWVNSKTKIVVYRQDHEIEKQKKKSYIEIKQKLGCESNTAKQILSERCGIRDSRDRLLNVLGCRVNPYRFNRIKGFFFKYKDKPYIGIGIKYPDNYSLVYADNNITAKIYTDSVDSSLLTEQFSALKVEQDFKSMPSPQPCIVIQNEEIRFEIERRLRNISYYTDATFEWRYESIENLIFLNNRLRGFKYTQDVHIFELFKDMVLFDASALKLPDSQLSYMAPIVVEEHNGQLYVIKGNTRCLYAWRHGIKQLKVVIVKNISAELPIDGTPKSFYIDNLFVSEDSISGVSRYGNKFKKELYRPIEETLRQYSTYLK